jgi:hypothetical protein
MQDFLFYLNLGWEHIISLDALDHQLFVLALIAVYSYSDWKKILILVTHYHRAFHYISFKYSGCFPGSF